MFDLNEYLVAFPGTKASDKIGETELNEIMLNSVSNGCIRKVYVQGLDCESITFKICKHILTYGNI